MQAQIGDYIKFLGYADGATSPTVPMMSKVVDISTAWTNNEEYLTASGDWVLESDLGIDDILLESEVEIG